MNIEPIKPEHKKILDKIRDLYVRSGGKPLGEPEAWGLNENGKSIEGIEIYFDYGIPMRMFTPDGYYVILGSSVCGDYVKFWEFFIQEFETYIVSTKRVDDKTPYVQYQMEYSGPVVRIR